MSVCPQLAFPPKPLYLWTHILPRPKVQMVPKKVVRLARPKISLVEPSLGSGPGVRIKLWCSCKCCIHWGFFKEIATDLFAVEKADLVKPQFAHTYSRPFFPTPQLLSLRNSPMPPLFSTPSPRPNLWPPRRPPRLVYFSNSSMMDPHQSTRLWSVERLSTID